MCNLYTRIDYLTAALTAAHHDAVADQVTDMVRAGATGTEILIGVRYALIQFQSTKPDISPDLAKQLSNVIAQIEQILT